MDVKKGNENMSLYRPTFTKPIPPGAEFIERKGERFAKWKDRQGRQQAVLVTMTKSGKARLLIESRVWRFRYRDGSGNVRDVSTGCRDEVAAKAKGAELERRAELVKANVLTASEDAAADHGSVQLSKHFDDYIQHLRAKGCSPARIGMVRSRLDRVARDCRLSRLSELNETVIERWLVARADDGLGAAARNNYREAFVGFGSWCRRTKRLLVNPFLDVPLANVKADRRHQRRALTEDELTRLLTVARLRPLAEYGRETVQTEPDPARPKRANWTRVPLTCEDVVDAANRARAILADNPALIRKLEDRGWERAITLKALLLTGLRKGELASLTVASLDFTGVVAFARLNAADEKNRQGSEIPLRADLAAELREWLDHRLKALRNAARLPGEPIPVRLPANTRVFDVPSGLGRILDRDLRAAGIPKRDDRGRVVDVHAMRMTFGTHLSKGGIPLRTAQAAMRHSKPELTANVYTDPRLLDVAGALGVLPALPLTNPWHDRAARAIGPDRALALLLALNTDQTGVNGGKADHGAGKTGGAQSIGWSRVSADSVNKNGSQSTQDHEPASKRVKGVEPSTSTLATLRSTTELHPRERPGIL